MEKFEPRVYEVEIEGVRPLIHNRFPDASVLSTKVAKSNVYEPKKLAEAGVYRSPTTGLIYQPADHIEGALINGAKNIKFKAHKTYKDIVAQNLIVEPREIPLPQEYEISEMIGTNHNIGGGKVRLARPMWSKWGLKFKVIDTGLTNYFDENTIMNILTEAGQVGIGTFRLKYGKFTVRKVEAVKPEVK